MASQVLPHIVLSFESARRFRRRTVHRLAANDGRRLGAAAASTASSAGYFRSCLHVNFSGVAAAVAPNRAL